MTGWLRHRFRYIAAGLVACLLLLLIAGELVARFYLGLGDPPLSVADPQVEYYFKPGTYHRIGHLIHYNAFSMRSDDISATKSDPKQLRVLVIGDSVINGGVQTDQSELATSLLQKKLSQRFGRPTFVGNISAGSWGPPNEDAYLHKFGRFDADAVILEVSGHDGADAPTFEPVVGVVPEMPDHKPVSALWEGFTRYLIPRLRAGSPPPDPSVPEGSKPLSDMTLRRKECRDAIIDMADLCRSHGIPFAVMLYWAKDELENGADPSQFVLLDAVKDKQIPLLNLEQKQRDALRSGQVIFRDRIHPNVAGQRLISDALEPFIENMVRTPAPATTKSSH